MSEYLLQQTRVDTVLKHWQRFHGLFPTPFALAQADAEDVRAAWSGLGYYRRAGYLHHAAKQIVSKHSGVVPKTAEDLAALPGVGRYTLGAVASHAFNLPFPILDGNVMRVLSRLDHITENIQSSTTQKRLWLRAEALLPSHNPRDFNQALMDLGATVCSPKKPLCHLCPWQHDCRAHRRGVAESVPIRIRKNKVPTTFRAALVVTDKNDRLLLQQRPSGGLLARMWEPVACDIDDPSDSLVHVKKLSKQLKTRATPKLAGTISHRFTHRVWAVSVFTLTLRQVSEYSSERCRWVPIDDLDKLGVPTVTRKMLQCAGLNRTS